MQFKKYANKLRKAFFHKLTKGIGSAPQIISGAPKPAIRRILISRPNHRLGNMLLVTPLVQEIENSFPDCKVDLFVKGNVARIIFENYPNVDTILRLPKKSFKEFRAYLGGWWGLKRKKYDLVISASGSSSSGRLSVKFARATYKLFGDPEAHLEARYPDYRHMAKYPVYNFRHFLSLLGYPETDHPVPPLSLHLSEAELEKGKAALNELTGNHNKTICIFTYATGAKCYPESWWLPFFEQLKRTFPNNNIVEMLPVENVSQIGFAAPHYYSKDIRQIAAFIASTEVFIGADSGMMHLACASGKPVVGLFSVTAPGVYRPYGNGSVAVDTNQTDTEGLIGIVSGLLN